MTNKPNKWQIINKASRYVLATYYNEDEANKALAEINANFNLPRYELIAGRRTR